MKSFILALVGLFLLCSISVAQPPPEVDGQIWYHDKFYTPGKTYPWMVQYHPVYETEWTLVGDTWVSSTNDDDSFILYLKVLHRLGAFDSWSTWEPPGSPYTLSNNGGYGYKDFDYSSWVDSLPISGEYKMEARVKQDGEWITDWVATPVHHAMMPWEPDVTEHSATGHYDNFNPGNEHCDVFSITVDPEGQLLDNGEDVDLVATFYSWNETFDTWSPHSTITTSIDYIDRDNQQIITYYYTGSKLSAPREDGPEYRVLVKYGHTIDDIYVYTKQAEFFLEHDNLTDLD